MLIRLLKSILCTAEPCCVFTCIADSLVLVQLSQQRSSKPGICKLVLNGLTCHHPQFCAREWMSVCVCVS